MSTLRTHAVFQLVAIGLTVLAVGTIYLVTRDVMVSQAGFATLALIGFSEIYFRRPSHRPIQDERDQANSMAATRWAFALFWLCFVAWGVMIPMRFAAVGSVPLRYVAPVVWMSFALFVGVRSAALLILDSRGL